MTIRDVMTPNPTVCPATTSLADAAKVMRDRDIGDVLVERDGKLCGVVTDRDIVVRGVAADVDPGAVRIGDICSRELATLSPTDSVRDAVALMRERALRRLPIVESGRPVGIVSLGDLAIERDADSALADISAAPANS
ncbi:MAG TPA: CBS domain-containing protein [Acidimicrobiales bacterium]|nr:CBS domain-containing protein [Acidimicrobiales bacterium]